MPYFLRRWVYQHSNYESYAFKMFVEASAHRHDGSLAQLPAPLASQRMWSWVELKVPSFSSWFDFLVTSPHPETVQRKPESAL